MLAAAVILSSLLLTVVDANSQVFPHVSFIGQTLANHSYVNLSLVGSNGSGHGVLCHADLPTCCQRVNGVHSGDWYFPNRSRLLFTGDIYQYRGAQRVDLYSQNSVISPAGLYCCDIPTNNSHEDVREILYVGLYYTEGGTYVTL